MHVFDALATLLTLNIYAELLQTTLQSSHNFWSKNGQNLPNVLPPNMFLQSILLPNFPPYSLPSRHLRMLQVPT